MILTVKTTGKSRGKNPPQLRETNIVVFCHVISRAFVRWRSVSDGNPKTVTRRPEEIQGIAFGMQSRDLLRDSPEMHCKIVFLCCFFPSGIKIAFVAIWRVSCSELGYCLKRCTNPELIARCEHILCMISCELNERANLVPRSYSVTGNVRSGKIRQYTIFHWPLKKRLRQCNVRSDWLISRGT